MPANQTTRSEFAARAELLRVDSYDITLDLTQGDQVFGSVCVIRFGCARPGAASYADLTAASVQEITLNGARLDPARVCSDGRIALTGLAESNELRVVARCAYTGDGSGLHRAVDSADGRVYIYAVLYPADARRVFACFDQQDLKASLAFHVTAPAHWTVLSNQPPAPPAASPVPGSGEGGEGREGSERAVVTWHFPPGPPLCTYHGALIAGEYYRTEQVHTTPAGQQVTIGLACRHSLAQYLEPADVLALTRTGLDYYTGLLATPFPFEKYDQVYVPEFPAGANSCPGCVAVSEQYLFRSRVSEARYEARTTTLLHEMAHQWFGEVVSPAWWDDMWLNESFASLCGSQATAEATRFTDAWTAFCAGRKVWAYRQDQQPSTHPVAARVDTLAQAVTNIDGISYAKGASVLRQLQAYLGREVFFGGLGSYFAAHRWGNATLADLLAALSARSGRDLADWSAAWLETAGVNTLRPDFEVDAAGAFTSFAVRQEAPAEQPVLRPHRVAVGLYEFSSGLLVRCHRAEVALTGERTAAPGLTGLGRPDLIVINDDDLDYAVIRFDEVSLRTLRTSIGDIADPLARAVCWSALLDMALQGELPTLSLVRTLAASMGRERSASVLQSLLERARQLMAELADPATVPECQDALAAAALRLLREAEPGSDRQLAWAQLLTWTARSGEQLDLLTGLLDGTASVPGLPVDTELRWALLLRLATTGRAGDPQIDAEVARDSTDEGRRHALACRAAIGDAAHKAAAWRLLTQDGELGANLIREVAGAFAQPEQAALVAPYAGEYFAVLPALWAARSDMLGVLLGKALFPYGAAGPELLGRIGQFLGAEQRDPGLARIVIEGRDIVEKSLHARTLAAG
jgi:aminopeptidase N